MFGAFRRYQCMRLPLIPFSCLCVVHTYINMCIKLVHFPFEKYQTKTHSEIESISSDFKGRIKIKSKSQHPLAQFLSTLEISLFV